MLMGGCGWGLEGILTGVAVKYLRYAVFLCEGGCFGLVAGGDCLDDYICMLGCWADESVGSEGGW